MELSAEAAIGLAKGLMVLGMSVNAVCEAWVVTTAFKAIGRNPQLENSLFPKVIIAVALVESTAIYTLVAFFTF